MLSSLKKKIRFSFYKLAQFCLYRSVGARELADLWREKGAVVGKNIHIAPNCFLEPGFEFLLKIEDNVTIAFFTKIILHDSAFCNVLDFPVKVGRVVIGEGTYIGSNVTIFPGVKIGKGCVIGANSMVTKSINDGMVAFGAPAKEIAPLSSYDCEKWAQSTDMVTFYDYPSQAEKKNLAPEEINALLEAKRLEIKAYFEKKDKESNT